MRCPDCNKFTGLETQEPEVSDLEVDGSPNDGKKKIDFEKSDSLEDAEAASGFDELV